MTYEYICTACGHQWEAEQRISSEPLNKCPKCEQESAKRLVSGGLGFILKGSGWYADGYGLGGKKNGGAQADPGKDGAEAKAPAGAADSKPAAKSTDSEAKSDTKKAPPADKGSAGSKPAAA